MPAVYRYGLLLMLLLAACGKKQDVQAVDDGPVRPAHFPAPYYNFGANTFSQAGFELGKRLFYDNRLSVNNTISCASCHKKEDAFADRGKAFSEGINGLYGKRNSPAIFNMAWNRSFMWDGGVTHIEVMPLAPLTNPVEMGETINGIVTKLNADPLYRVLFSQVFHKDSIDDQQMFRALAQYMANVVSAGAKYDRYIKGEEQFNESEKRGYLLFITHCESCHREPLFTGYTMENNGLDTVFSDIGRFRVSQDSSDLGKFKVPTLRNVEVTGPYMHDGRIATLQQVLNHYSDGVRNSPTLSAKLVRDGQPGLHLSEQEQADLIHFLHTLTDYTLLNNPEY